MKILFKSLIVLFSLCLLSPVAFATNGDNLIAIGPIARAMGGVGIARPLDAISAVFANPAAMCFGPYCPSSEVNFAGTLFMPDISAEVQSPGSVVKSNADDKVYAIPAFGLSVPVTSAPPFWRFGLAAYGVTGLGVDYRGTAINSTTFPTTPPAPLVQGAFTQLQIMKFAPAVAFQPTEQFSFGLAVHVDYASLDLQNGSSFNYGIGVQAGMIYKPIDAVSIGLNYISPQNVEHENVLYNQQTGEYSDLELESPQQIGAGLAYTLLNERLLFEGDVKWINWADAKGYDDFDWDNQWVFAFGVQYQPITRLFLRAGYNYAQNPVNEHNGWNGSFGPTGPNSVVDVQGTIFPTYYYETFRVIGFPAVVEQHVTFGVGYEFSDRLSLNVGYVHGFEKTIEETGTNPLGQPTTLKSTLSEDSVDFGLTWRF